MATHRSRSWTKNKRTNKKRPGWSSMTNEEPLKKKIRINSKKSQQDVNSFLDDNDDFASNSSNVNRRNKKQPKKISKSSKQSKEQSKEQSKQQSRQQQSSKKSQKKKVKSNENGRYENDKKNKNGNKELEKEKSESNEIKDREDEKNDFENEKKEIGDLPSDFDSFESLNIRQDTLAMIKSMGFEKMLEIQSKSIPLLLKGNNLVGAAKTGSGKTLAYLIPAIEKCVSLDWDFAEQGVACIILAPTRELAIQIESVTKKLIRLYKDSIKLGLLIGGNPRTRDIASMLNYGMTMVIATPGRLLDHMMQTREFVTKNVKILIMDEADRMLEEGYQEEINQILKRLPKKDRQTILFSATQTRKTEDLIRLSFDSKPIFVGLDAPRSSVLNNKTNDNNNKHENSNDNNNNNQIDPTREDLTQGYILVPAEKKFLLLFSFLKRNSKNKKIIVFFSTVNATKYFVELLNYIDIKVYGLYGAMSQKQRTKTFLSFQESESGILLATNVAARGLDIPNIDWIVQYDPSDDIKDYIHRVGRTCRGGENDPKSKNKKGKALLFLIPNEIGYLNVLKKHNIGIKEFTLPQSSKVANIQTQLEKLTSNVYHLHVLAHHAYTAYMKQYAMRNTKIFDVLKLNIVSVAKSFGLNAPPKVNVEIARKHKKKEGNGETTVQRRYKSVNLRLKTNQWAKKQQKSQFSFSAN